MDDDDAEVIPFPGAITAEALADLGPPWPDPASPAVGLLVAAAMEHLASGACATTEQAILWAVVNGYAEGWSDAMDLDLDE